MTYEEFESAAAEYFGMDPYEAALLAEQLAGAGWDLDTVDPRDKDMWEEASTYEAVDMALADVELPDDEAYDDYGYELDPYFPDDDWLEPDIEWEMTAETDDTYRETA